MKIDKSAIAIIQTVCKTLNVEENKMLSSTRTRPYADARFLCAHFIRKHLPEVTLKTMGAWLNRDHSTVIYLIRQAEHLSYSDEPFKEKFNECSKALSFFCTDVNFKNIPQL